GPRDVAAVGYDAAAVSEARDRMEAPAPRGAVRATVTSGKVPSDYRLAPRDQVVFEMFNEPDVGTTQRLSSSGEMTLPLIGAVTLAGMTLREAEQEIRRRYIE